MASAEVAQIYNWLTIDETLATSGQPSEGELATVARAGFELVINLALHDDPRYSLQDEAGTVRALGMRYVHIPVQFDSPQEHDLARFFQAMDARGTTKTLVHCAANKRVTAFLGLYRVIRQGIDEHSAFAPMRAVWEPNENWAPFISAMLARKEALHGGSSG